VCVRVGCCLRVGVCVCVFDFVVGCVSGFIWCVRMPCGLIYLCVSGYVFVVVLYVWCVLFGF